MKKKHLILIVVGILAVALVLGLALSQWGKDAGTDTAAGDPQSDSGDTSGDHSSPDAAPADGTAESTGQPTSGPTSGPSSAPASESTADPVPQPSGTPTSESTAEPVPQPTGALTFDPTGTPTSQPSGTPTPQPSGTPTSQPSGTPTPQPSGTPSSKPTGTPTPQPSGTPSSKPTGTPTPQPSGTPSSKPTGTPTPQPSGTPSSKPTTPSEPAATPTPAPTQTPHIHTFVKKETVAPTMDSPGYTRYVCSVCGYSYEGDIVAALTLQQYINQQKLTPAVTGIDALDQKVSSVLAAIIPQGASNYEKLEAIYNYILTQFSHGGGSVDVSKTMQFADGKVFKNASELVISYEAYQILTEKQGVSDHYAAAFMVLTRAVGFESYVVNGTLDGSNHVWNNVLINGKLYAFDTYTTTAPQFAETDQTLPGYSYQDRTGAIAAQTGFQSADVFKVRLTVTDQSGTAVKEYTWDADDVLSGASNFMKNTVTVKAAGTVSYKLEIVSGSGSFQLANENGSTTDSQKVGSSISGTLEPGSGYYTLQAKETNSMMQFDIRIDN